jgi:hypothetical protein
MCSFSSHVVISPNLSVGNSVYFKILTKRADVAQCHKISSAIKYVISQKRILKKIYSAVDTQLSVDTHLSVSPHNLLQIHCEQQSVMAVSG